MNRNTLVLNIGLDGIKGKTDAYSKKLAPTDVALRTTKALNFKVIS